MKKHFAALLLFFFVLSPFLSVPAAEPPATLMEALKILDSSEQSLNNIAETTQHSQAIISSLSIENASMRSRIQEQQKSLLAASASLKKIQAEFEARLKRSDETISLLEESFAELSKLNQQQEEEILLLTVSRHKALAAALAGWGLLAAVVVLKILKVVYKLPIPML